MSCAACGQRVEGAMSGTYGVFSANANLATEKATVEYDLALVGTGALIRAVEDAGCGVEKRVSSFGVTGMSCAGCVASVEKALRSVPGVIDAMVPHHEGAVEMARVAVKNAEHPEIEHLAQHIISNQKAEINELESIKKEEYGTSKVPSHMSMGQMEGMMMSAIEMAQVACDETDNPRIKDLATGIVSAQKREIFQMKQWRTQWYQKD